MPEPVRDVIRDSHRGDRECKTALAEYFVSSMPGASWTTLACALYHEEESAALLAVGRHLKEEKGWWGNAICLLCTFRVCGSQRLLVLSLVVCVVAYCALVNCVSPSVSVNCTANFCSIQCSWYYYYRYMLGCYRPIVHIPAAGYCCTVHTSSDHCLSPSVVSSLFRALPHSTQHPRCV